MSFNNKLKKRWNVDTDREVLVILLVFALTGSTMVYVYGFIKNWLGFSDATSFVLKFLAFVFIGFPLYNVLLVLWGMALGQGPFFKRFVMNLFRYFRK